MDGRMVSSKNGRLGNAASGVKMRTILWWNGEEDWMDLKGIGEELLAVVGGNDGNGKETAMKESDWRERAEKWSLPCLFLRSSFNVASAADRC
jgi:hypothetical protein